MAGLRHIRPGDPEVKGIFSIPLPGPARKGHEPLLRRSPLESAPTRAHGHVGFPQPCSSQPVAEPPPAPPWEALLSVVGLVVLSRVKYVGALAVVLVATALRKSASIVEVVHLVIF